MHRSEWPLDLPKSGRDALTLATGVFNPLVFREYDVRGQVVPTEPRVDGLNEFLVNRIGRAFGTMLDREGVKAVAVGYDSRSYSESIANALISGLLSTGREVVQIGLATTPMVYFAQHALGGIAGVSVTASHNPDGWAGLKLSAFPSITLGTREVAELRELCAERTFVSGIGTYREQSVTMQYVEYIAHRLPASEPLKVVVDGGNSISGPIARMVLESVGHQVVAINEELDWSFPNHEPDPESLAARIQAQGAVKEVGANCAVSLDGDGDRLGITDELGGVVWSDAVLAILAEDVLRTKPGAPIVFDVKCSRAVPEVIKRSGGVPLMWATGHSHIKAKMREVGSPFSGERSGHFFYGDPYLGYDDGIYAGVRFLDVLGRQGVSVTEIVSRLPQYVGTPTMQAFCADDRKYQAIEEFAEYATDKFSAREIVRVNGVRAEFDEGWLLVRASSNLPSLVLVAEADSHDGLSRMYERLRAGLNRDPSVATAWENDPFDGSA